MANGSVLGDLFVCEECKAVVWIDTSHFDLDAAIAEVKARGEKWEGKEVVCRNGYLHDEIPGKGPYRRMTRTEYGCCSQPHACAKAGRCQSDPVCMN